MNSKGFPPQESDVEVVFTDGTVKTYRISAGSGISSFLAQQTASTGILTLFNGPVSWSIPITQIREYTITTVLPPEVPS